MTRIIFVTMFLVLYEIGSAAWAEQLDQESCRNLRTQRDALVILGVKKHMEKGPEWVLANLDQSELFQIKNYIFVRDQLQFRCPIASSPKKHKKSPKRRKKKNTNKKSK